MGLKSSPLRKVHGPAAALGFTLKSIGWQINATGNVSVTAFLDFHFLGVSLKRFRRFLGLTWQTQHIQTHANRWSWFQFPDICADSANAVLKQFADPQGRLLIQEIAGGYQLASQKEHWQEDVDGSCPLCNQPVSRRHRWFECPAHADTRAPFRKTLDAILDSGLGLPDFPVVCVEPDSEAFQLMHFHLPGPVWSPQILAKIQAYLAQGLQPQFFTDGSCQLPTSCLTRCAGFAVVWDLCVSDEERMLWADTHVCFGGFTKSLQPVSSTMCCAEQDILRAELLAICDVVENCHTGCIHVDSQTALNLASLALAN